LKIFHNFGLWSLNCSDQQQMLFNTGENTDSAINGKRMKPIVQDTESSIV